MKKSEAKEDELIDVIPTRQRTRLENAIYMQYLRIKSKFRKIGKWKITTFVIGSDLTFIFVFLALTLFGYQWTWKTLLGSLGIWIVFKDVMKHVRMTLNVINFK